MQDNHWSNVSNQNLVLSTTYFNWSCANLVFPSCAFLQYLKVCLRTYNIVCGHAVNCRLIYFKSILKTKFKQNYRNVWNLIEAVVTLKLYMLWAFIKMFRLFDRKHFVEMFYIWKVFLMYLLYFRVEEDNSLLRTAHISLWARCPFSSSWWKRKSGTQVSVGKARNDEWRECRMRFFDIMAWMPNGYDRNDEVVSNDHLNSPNGRLNTYG